MSTSFITDKIFLQHEMGRDHPECPLRLSNLVDQLKKANLGDLIQWVDEPPKATKTQIALAHNPEYISKLSKISPSDGYQMIDGDTIMNKYSVNAAYYAAGACIHSADLIMQNQTKNAFCAVRPPGHHATQNQAMGFCFFNNIAITGMHLIDKYNFQRIAVIDFDVHHGNGTEDILANHQNFYMFSTFEYPLYPYSGEKPLGDNMLNIPIPSYGNGKHLVNAVKKWDLIIEKFQPQFILVSAGYDAHQDDYLSTSQWTDQDYQWLSQKIVEYSNKYCQGKIIVVLEGGYNINALARNAITMITELTK